MYTRSNVDFCLGVLSRGNVGPVATYITLCRTLQNSGKDIGMYGHSDVSLVYSYRGMYFHKFHIHISGVHVDFYVLCRGRSRGALRPRPPPDHQK